MVSISISLDPNELHWSSLSTEITARLAPSLKKTIFKTWPISSSRTDCRFDLVQHHVLLDKASGLLSEQGAAVFQVGANARSAPHLLWCGGSAGGL